MPLLPISLGKGSLAAVDPLELSSADLPATMKNLCITKAGGNTDRPGLSPNEFATLGSFPCVGLSFFNGYAVGVTSSRRIFAIDSAGAVTEITGTNSLGGTSRPTFASDGTYLAIAGGGEPQRWNGDITSPCEELPGSAPDCTHIVYLDGYWILFTADELRWAGPTAALRESWDANNFFQAEGLPDGITSIAVNQRELHVIGSKSIEVFQNFGDNRTPFQRTFFIDREDNQSQTTTAQPNFSLLKADNTLWFFDAVKKEINVLEQRTPKIVSTQYERDIKTFSTVSDCFGYRIDLDGFYQLVWVFPTENRVFALDYEKREWSEWTSRINLTEGRFLGNAYVYADTWNKHLVADYNAGTIYELSRAYKADGPYEVNRLRRTGSYDHGTALLKKSQYYLFHVKRGVGTVGSDEPLLQVRVNDDNQGWSEPQLVGLGYPGESQEPIRVDCPGIYRKRQLEFSMTDGAELLVSKVEEMLTPLSR